MQYIENDSKLDRQTSDFVRALKSLMEELEAISYYQQRADTTTEPELKSIVEHNRDEEIEHCCMLIEWLRRNMPVWDENLKIYLFTTAPLTQVEADAESGDSGGGSDGDLGVRKLK